MTETKMKIALGAVIVLAGIVTPAIGQTVSRVYTQLDADKCRHTKGRDVEDYGSWRCAGHAGIDVYLSAGDQRMFVSFGRNAAREPAARQTFPLSTAPTRAPSNGGSKRRRTASRARLQPSCAGT